MCSKCVEDLELCHYCNCKSRVNISALFFHKSRVNICALFFHCPCHCVSGKKYRKKLNFDDNILIQCGNPCTKAISKYLTITERDRYALKYLTRYIKHGYATSSYPDYLNNYNRCYNCGDSLKDVLSRKDMCMLRNPYRFYSFPTNGPYMRVDVCHVYYDRKRKRWNTKDSRFYALYETRTYKTMRGLF